MRRLLIIYGLLFSALSGKAQTDSAESAINHYHEGRLDLAKIAIDAAITNPQLAASAHTWNYRAFIYKDISKKASGADVFVTRDESIRSSKKAIELDKKREFINESRSALKFLGSKYNNDAVANLNPDNYSKAIEYYAKYKDCMRIADSTFNEKGKTIEFNLALASLFTKIYDSDRKGKTDLLPKIETLYNEVLSLDSNNYTANYNLGLHYWNQAVHIINEMEYDLDIIALNDIEDKTIVLFKKALPYMEKGYKLYPTRKETLIGLQGIYFSLNEFDKSNKIKEELDKLK